MTPTERVQKMASEMIVAAEDAHGYLSMPVSGEAFEFCQQAEYDEPGTYPLFVDVAPEIRLGAMRRYANYRLRRRA